MTSFALVAYSIISGILLVLAFCWTFLPFILMIRLRKMHEELEKTNAQLVHMTQVFIDSQSKKD